MQYSKALDSKLESNLNFIANRLKVSRQDIEFSQKKYLNRDVTLVLGREEFMNSNVPAGFDADKAWLIRDEMEQLSEEVSRELGITGIFSVDADDLDETGKSNMMDVTLVQ